jgi:hypothetical protein
MAWWVPLIGAGIGLLQGKKQEEMQRKQMLMDAQAMKGAPLYGQAPARGNAMITPASNAAMQGAMAGMQFAALNKNLWGDDAKADTAKTKGKADNLALTYDRPIGPQLPAGYYPQLPPGYQPPPQNVGPMASGDLYAQMIGG